MTKPRLVLDTNCLIDLDERRPDAQSLDRLVAAHREGRILLAVGAISASENQPSGQPSANYSVFLDRLERIGLPDIEQLLPLGTWGVGYWDKMIWSDEESDKEAEAIRAALFPGETPPSTASPEENRKWRNHHCDAMLAWCCIHYGWLALVTRDSNFHKRKADLAALGLHAVLSPQEAVEKHAP